MTQVTITLKKSKQADALLNYLESLDFVTIERNTASRVPKNKAQKAAQDARDFLESLPNRSAKQTDVNKAINEMRKGNFD